MTLQEILTSAVLVFLLIQNLILMLIWWQGRQQPVAPTVQALPAVAPQPAVATPPVVQVDTAPEYATAIQALRRGADPRQVSQEFGITQSEADLLRHLHP